MDWLHLLLYVFSRSSAPSQGVFKLLTMVCGMCMDCFPAGVECFDVRSGHFCPFLPISLWLCPTMQYELLWFSLVSD